MYNSYPMPPADRGFSDPKDRQQPMTPMDEGVQIQMAYQQFLGRPASPEEIQNWLSGTYGHGQSGNLMPIFEAIRQSGEAQQRPPMSGPMPPRPMPGSPDRFTLPPRRPGGMPPGAQPMRPAMQNWQQGLRAYRSAGEAQGNDMSWMDQPNAVSGPAGTMTYAQATAAGPRRRGPMSNPEIAQMRKAILGVPEY